MEYKMRKTQGHTWLFTFVLLSYFGCQEKARLSKAPPVPSTSEVQSLLNIVEDLERKFGLAVIAATPPKIGRKLFSKSDMEDQLQETKNEIEFLNKGKPHIDELMSAKSSIWTFLKSPNDKDWNNAWQHLVTVHSELVDFMGSELWRDQVPLKESQEMMRQLELLNESTTHLMKSND